MQNSFSGATDAGKVPVSATESGSINKNAVVGTQWISEEIIGRQSELSRIEEVWTEAQTSGPETIVLWGDAGIGKTRLLTEALTRIESYQATVFLGRCLPPGAGSRPFSPLTEILRSLAVHERRDDWVSPDTPLTRLAPTLVPGGKRNAKPVDPETLFEEVLSLIERIASDTPLALAIEDMHWADESTRSLIGFLAHYVTDLPVLLLLTVRADDLHRRHPVTEWLAEFERAQRPHSITVEPLPVSAAEELIASLNSDISQAALTNMVERSGGNPFFLEELVAASGESDVPARIRDVVISRLKELPEFEYHVLRVAAAAGTSIDVGVIAAVLSETDLRISDALSVIIEQGHVTISQDRTELRFRHELLREALYDTLIPGERTRIHTTIAETLIQQEIPNHGEISYHWAAANEITLALPASIAAAEEAEPTGALAEAEVHYRRAMDLWGNVSNAEEMTGVSLPELVRRYAKVCVNTGNVDTAIDVLVSHQDVGSFSDLINTMADLTHAYWISHDDQYATALNTIRLYLDDDPLPEDRLQILCQLSGDAFLAGKGTEAIEWADQAAALAAELGNTAKASSVELGKATAQAELGLAEGLRALVGFYNLAEAGHPCTPSYYLNYSNVLNHERMPVEALRIIEKGLAWASANGHGIHTTLILRINELTSLLSLGRWTEAERVGTILERGTHLTGTQADLAEAWLRYKVETGDFESADSIAQVAAPDGGEDSRYFDIVNPLAVSNATLALYRNEPESAINTIDGSLSFMPSRSSVRVPELAAYGARAAADLSIRQQHLREPTKRALDAGKRYAKLCNAALADERIELQGFQAAMAAWNDMVRLENLRAAGSTSGTDWVAQSELMTDLYYPIEAAYCQYRAGEAFLAQDKAQASISLRDAALRCTHLGAVPLLELVDRLAIRGRIDLYPEEGESQDAIEIPFGLTDREVDVLRELATGATNIEIGELLFISPKTVAAHVSHILTKLNAKNRGEAVAIAGPVGLL